MYADTDHVMDEWGSQYLENPGLNNKKNPNIYT